MIIRNVRPSDWQRVSQIESSNFSKEEAMTEDAIKQRCQRITDTFLVAELDDQIVGYIEGPVVKQPILEDHLFHDVKENPLTGGYIAITSLSIEKMHQQEGIGIALLAALKDVAISQERSGIILTCHEELIAYYEMNGFSNLGLSDSTHGGSVWYLMSWLAI
ncbi:GNAT family N-acetyltransferase [Streptococcus hongkongensis]|nr:GNAT family acetyltransferase [Streptococcus uberis]